mmetsp:Transcript_77019/g.217946  ORF Transcript_77019/g.217946 Transcript_77019/m.217946 type:complete len:208 (-) Transcript_77019:716-1339(-)
MELIKDNPPPVEHLENGERELPPVTHRSPIAVIAARGLAVGDGCAPLKQGLGDLLQVGQGEPLQNFRTPAAVNRAEEEPVRAENHISLGQLLCSHVLEGPDIDHGKNLGVVAAPVPAIAGIVHSAGPDALTIPKELVELLEPLLQQVRRHHDKGTLRRDETAPVSLGDLGCWQCSCSIDKADGCCGLAVAYLVTKDASPYVIRGASA